MTEQDPITEVRRALRERPTDWDRARPKPQPHVGRAVRSFISRTTWAIAAGVVSYVRRSASMIDRAGTVADVRARKALLRAAALADRELRTFGTWSVAMATALGDATRPRPRPAPPLVEREPEPVAEPVAERMTSPDDPDGRFERLERYQLEQRVAVLGADHPDVALLLYLIGTRCAARGAPQEAVDLYRQALQIQERAFGINSAALKPLLIDLAEAERIVGLEEDAADHDARSLALDEAHLPQFIDDAEDERGSRPRLELLN